MGLSSHTSPNDPCSYCSTYGGMIDHIIYDAHGWQNLTSTCKACNTAKQQRSLLRHLLAVQLRHDRQAADTFFSEQLRLCRAA